jgi:hypothetical protein
MVLEVLALALWIPLGLVGLWFLVTGRKIIYGLPRGLKEGWQMRVFGLAYTLMTGYISFLAIRDGSVAADGVVIGYVALIGVVLYALYRRQKARRAEAIVSRP